MVTWEIIYLDNGVSRRKYVEANTAIDAVNIADVEELAFICPIDENGMEICDYDWVNGGDLDD